MAHSAQISEVSAAVVTQRNMEAEIREAVKSHAQRLWEKGEDEAILKFGYAHLAKCPAVDNRVLKSGDAERVRKVVGKQVRHRMEVWEQGDDGIWRKTK